MEAGHTSDKGRFLAVLSINIFLFIVELLVGYSSGSLSMISDSFHTSLHIFASLVALASEYELFGLSPNKIKSLSSGINIVLFFPLAFMIAYRAYERWGNPPIINLNSVFFIIATLGLTANLYTVIILKPDHRGMDLKNKNRFYLFIHMIFDTIGSIIVLAGAIEINRTSNYWIDPASSFILAGLIVLAAIWMSREFISGHNHIH